MGAEEQWWNTVLFRKEEALTTKYFTRFYMLLTQNVTHLLLK